MKEFENSKMAQCENEKQNQKTINYENRSKELETEN